MTRTPDIELTPEEQDLVTQISFDPKSREQWQQTLPAMKALTEHLLERGAVPEVRLKYFSDPEFFPGGRGKSHRDVFERNGTRGDEILEHGNFLKFLEYFLCGPDLPTTIIARFKDAAASFGYLSGSDLLELAPEARALVRAQRMNPHEASEEFFKLALECGAQPSSADILRRSVRAVR